MTRLCKYDREKLERQLVAHRFAEFDLETKKIEHDLAGRCYETLYTNGERVAMHGLPRGWLSVAKQIQVKIDGVKKNNYVILSFAKPLPMQNQHTNGFALVLDMATPLAADLDAFIERRVQRMKDGAELRTTIAPALAAFSTVAGLVKAWPEVEPFLPAHVAQPSQAIALPIAALNAALGLVP